jgi:hypothetical protein
MWYRVIRTSDLLGQELLPGRLRQFGQPASELDPGVQGELVEDVDDVGFHGALGQEQPGRDLPIGEVVRDKPC